ncbi:hypothetical protein MHAE_14400 [Mycobacterium haemophilum DSM 44634]
MLVALVIAVAAVVIGRPRNSLEIGAVATFLVLVVLTFALSESLMGRWMQSLSNAGILLVGLFSQLTGKLFVRDFAAAEQPDDVVKTQLFARKATILDAKTPLSVVCYWVIPFSLLGVTALASRFLLDRMLVGVDDIARETSFVAYDEATIDELYYLAQEHANREVGAGKEAYDVKVGALGTPLTGDESRKSWPSTYKVRERRH